MSAKKKLQGQTTEKKKGVREGGPWGRVTEGKKAPEGNKGKSTSLCGVQVPNAQKKPRRTCHETAKEAVEKEREVKKFGRWGGLLHQVENSQPQKKNCHQKHARCNYLKKRAEPKGKTEIDHAAGSSVIAQEKKGKNGSFSESITQTQQREGETNEGTLKGARKGPPLSQLGGEKGKGDGFV